jgi:hypothetical protein
MESSYYQAIMILSQVTSLAIEDSYFRNAFFTSLGLIKLSEVEEARIKGVKFFNMIHDSWNL